MITFFDNKECNQNIMTSETTTTTTTTPDVVDELVKYYLKNPPKEIMLIKPLGSFKESPYFLAVVNLYTNEKFNHSLRILSSCIYDNARCGNVLTMNEWFLKSRDIKENIIEAVNILNELKFDKVDAQFRRPYNRPSYEGRLDDIHNRLWDMQQDLECCVCKEATSTTTLCDHRLCVICWSNINGIAEKKHNTARCPICRKNIRYNEIDPYDETDEDSD